MLAMLAGLAVPAQAQLVPSPTTLSFPDASGSFSPQVLSLTSTPTGVTFQVTATTTSGGNWLTFSAPLSSTPAFIFVSVNTAGLAAGFYQGSLTITASGLNPVTVPVNLTVGGGGGTGAFTVTPTALNFTYQPGGSLPAQQQFTISSTTPISWVLNVQSTVPGWLAVSPQSGGPATFSMVQVLVNPTSLSVGTYTGTIQVLSGSASQTVSVTLTVGTGGGGTATLTPSALTFNYQQGGALPPQQQLTLTTPTPTTFTATAFSTGNWLQVTPASGTTNPAATLTVSAIPSSLGVGSYTGFITVTPTGQQALIVTVTLNVTQAGTGGITLTPSALTFGYQVGGNLPSPQQVSLNTAVPTSFTAAALSSGWLSVSPQSGTTSPTAVLTISVNPTPLPPGSYTGFVTVSVPNQPPASVSVALTVTGTGGGGTFTVSPLSFNFTYQVGGTPPSQQTMVITTPTNSSYTAVPLSVGNWLQVVPASYPTTPSAQVSVGLNATALTGLPAGTYNGIITITVPNAATQTVTVTLTVTGGTSGISANPTSLTFNFLPGGTQPANQSFVLTTPAPAAFTAQASTSSGGNWLFVGPVQGATVGSPAQASISVGVNPTGLAIGVYTGTITVSVSGFAPLQVGVTLNVGNVATGALNPNQLSFTYQTGASTPPAQLVIVQTQGGQPNNFSVSVTTAQGGSWLEATPSAGTAPGILAVRVNPTGLAPGSYSGTVSVTLSGSAAPITLPVTLAVASTPLLRLNQNQATFNYQIGGSVSATQSLPIEVTSTSTALSFSVTTQVTTPAGGNWLSVSVPSGTTPATVNVQVNAANLPGGSFSGTVSFSVAGQAAILLPVTLNVGSSPLLNAEPRTLTFTAQVSATAPLPQTLAISSTGSSINFTPVATVITGSNWLSVSPVSASTPANLSVSANQAGLGEGVYYGAIRIEAFPPTAAGNHPLIVPVVLQVTGSANLVISPGPLSFTQFQGGGQPPAQELNIASSGTLLAYSLQVTTLTGGNWLSVTPTTGITPSRVSVSVNASGLALGTYSGSIIVTAPGAPNSPQVVPVTLTVSAPPTVSVNPSSLTFNANTAMSSVPSQTIELRSSGVNLNFSASASVSSGATQWLSVTPASGATPTNLTVAVNIAGLQPGTYTGTITINFGLAQPATVPVTLNLTTVNPPTILAIRHAATLAPTVLSPGLIVAITGNDLGPAVGQEMRITQGMVDTSLGGTRILFDGIPAPIIFARRDQVNAIVPYEIAGRLSVRVQAEYQGVRGNALDVRVEDVRPGIFTDNAQGFGQAAIHNPDYSRNGPSNPVARGSYATAYITGEGSLSPAGITGAIATASPLRRPIAAVRVVVGGREAAVINASVVPTTVMGYIQVSFFIPADAPTGSNVPLEVIVGGVSTQSGVTMAIR